MCGECAVSMGIHMHAYDDKLSGICCGSGGYASRSFRFDSGTQLYLVRSEEICDMGVCAQINNLV